MRESARVVGKGFFVMALPMILILLQPDLGSTLIIPPMVLAPAIRIEVVPPVFSLSSLQACLPVWLCWRWICIATPIFSTERGLTALEGTRPVPRRYRFCPISATISGSGIMTFVAPRG